MTETEPRNDVLAVLHDPSTLDYATDPVGAVLAACERAKLLLELVLEHGHIEHVAELKAQAQAIEVYTRQKNLGRDAGLAAAEIVRRAERGLGLAIRRGQERGEIETRLDSQRRASYSRHHFSSSDRDADGISIKARPRDFASTSEMHSTSGNIFDLTDDVTDEQFETAIETAKSEQNLARANVIRKVRDEQPKPKRPEHLRGMHYHDPNRIVEKTIELSGLDHDVEINYAGLDRDRLEMWISSLSSVIRSLNALKRNLQKELNRG